MDSRGRNLGHSLVLPQSSPETPTQQVELSLSPTLCPVEPARCPLPHRAIDGETHALRVPPTRLLHGGLFRPVPGPEQLETWVQGGPPASGPAGLLGDCPSVTVQDPTPALRRSARSDFHKGLQVQDLQLNSGAKERNCCCGSWLPPPGFPRVSNLCPSLRSSPRCHAIPNAGSRQAGPLRIESSLTDSWNETLAGTHA